MIERRVWETLPWETSLDKQCYPQTPCCTTIRMRAYGNDDQGIRKDACAGTPESICLRKKNARRTEAAPAAEAAAAAAVPPPASGSRLAAVKEQAAILRRNAHATVEPFFATLGAVQDAPQAPINGPIRAAFPPGRAKKKKTGGRT